MIDVLYDYMILSTRHESRNQTFTLDSASVSLEATDMASLPCVMTAASSHRDQGKHLEGHLCTKRSVKGPKIEPCATPTGLER